MRPTPPTRPSDEDIKRLHRQTMQEVRLALNWKLSEIIAIASDPTPRPWSIIAMVESCQRSIADLSSTMEEDGE